MVKRESKHSFTEQEKRINKVFTNDNVFVNKDNLKIYYNFLKSKIQKPCVLTGMEDFDWEEPYLLSGWCKLEYEKLKESNPSFRDIFLFVELDEEYDDWKGLYAIVKRLTDSKVFRIPLWDLKVTDVKDSNFIVMSDYSFWMTNY
jgi:hypothetical protein